MRSRPEATVRSFLDAIVASDTRAAVALFAPDAVYHERAWHDPVVGTEAIAAEFDRQAGIFADFSYEIRSMLATESVVFTERIDSMTIAGTPVSLHWASVAELDADGRITAMRDYYDIEELKSQLAL
ncbi:MAG TPA: nuclear transport factor 2 family protein [Mycobacteriales bacterium]|jgi:limonene-1,2-epoxide hydrolase|nr:nuclear transport factor 2 family protein [Mycobacteriales bacterium]